MSSGEARPTGQYQALSPEAQKMRKQRGQWLALGLFGFCVIVFAVSMTKLGQSVGQVTEARQWR